MENTKGPEQVHPIPTTYRQILVRFDREVKQVKGTLKLCNPSGRLLRR